MTSILNAVNAIETADDGADTGGLRAYILDSEALTEEVLDCLLAMPGTTDAGRLSQAADACANAEATEGASVEAFLASNTIDDEGETADEETESDDDGGEGGEDSGDSDPDDIPES